MPGSWSTTSPPTRTGAYFNFVSLTEQGLEQGVNGRAAILGTADWGPLDAPEVISGAGDFTETFGVSAGGTLRSAVLDALDGFDGGGAASVLAFRLAASTAAAATCLLKDATTATVLTLTAKYKGIRANNFHVTVQTYAGGSNKTLILYENGIELERWENITNGANDQFAAAINDPNFGSRFVTAASSGASGTVVSNVVGTIGGVGGFGTGSGGVAGNSGSGYTAGDLTTALTVIQGHLFESVAVGNLTDDTIRDVFVAWVKERANVTGKRCFVVIGGAISDPVTGGSAGAGLSGQARSVEYDHSDVINLGATDLKRRSDGVVLSTAQLAPRVAGAQAGMGIRRALTNLRLSGYQVSNSLTSANYAAASKAGIVTFVSDTIDRVRIEDDPTSLVSTNDTDRPKAHQSVRNVAISHFIQNSLDTVFKEQSIGSLGNTPTGRRDLVGSVLAFLKGLEEQNVLEPGTSEVHLDDAFPQTGNAVFLKVGVKYVYAIERIFVTVRVT